MNAMCANHRRWSITSPLASAYVTSEAPAPASATRQNAGERTGSPRSPGLGRRSITTGAKTNDAKAGSLVATASPTATPNVSARRMCSPSRTITANAHSAAAVKKSTGTSTLEFRA